MAAAAKGHHQVVEILINHGAEVNVKDSNQNTALMLATVKGFPGVVNLLLAAGASYRGSTPSATATALVSLSPDGEISGLELFHMGQRMSGHRFPVSDAYLWTAPSETIVVPALECRQQPCFLASGSAASVWPRLCDATPVRTRVRVEYLGITFGHI